MFLGLSYHIGTIKATVSNVVTGKCDIKNEICYNNDKKLKFNYE